MACHCVVYHPQTEEERKQIEDNARYFHRINDKNGIMITDLMLNTRCPGLAK